MQWGMSSVGLSVILESVDKISKLNAHFSPVGFSPFTHDPWRFCCPILRHRCCPWILPLRQAPSQTLFFKPSLQFLAPLHFSGMKFGFKIKTEPMTQASIIITVITVSLGPLVMIAIHSRSSLVCIFCAVILAIIVYAALRLAPC
jgi:hypothetical protein